MSATDPINGEDDGTTRPVFISYATADRKQALAACKAIEKRGIPCWIAGRDVAPGDNYQEAIVEAIRDARSMVLIFSGNANNSDEIKKELSLASRHQVPVMVLRIAAVEPSGAFAYELSTRQWIDAFKSWDRSIDALVARLGQMASPQPLAASTPTLGRSGALSFSRRSVALATGALLLLIAGGAWWWFRPTVPATQNMSVRLAGFQILSAGLPQTIGKAVDAEVAAAFNADGVVGVSTAPAAPPGSAPAYALGGTIQRDGTAIRVITRLTNERSGATLWTNTFNYDGGEVGNVPRHIAVDAGNVVRCGLFGASTYRKNLPDPVLRDYLQFCQGHWDPNISDGRKALLPAQRVVAAVPDFSWGWAAVAGAFWKVAMSADSDQAAEEARASGRDAADRAVALDSQNSEALWIKSMLVARRDWRGREDLLNRAIAARRLDCGCEHHQYGWMLLNVGRVDESLQQLRQASEMLALYVYTSLNLADALVAGDKLDEAGQQFQSSVGLAPNADFATSIRVAQAAQTGNLELLTDQQLPLEARSRAALLNAWRAAKSDDAGAKTRAAQALSALPAGQQSDAVALLLGRLGANHQAFDVAARLAEREYPGPSLFWYDSMRGTLNDPRFPALAARLGLTAYWKASGTKPDACKEPAPPPFCRMI